MKERLFKDVTVPDVAGRAYTHRISRAQAVSLIASRIPWERGDVLRTVKDRVQGRVKYAVRVRDLVPGAAGTYRLGDLVRWAKTKSDWPNCFDDLPVAPRRTCEAIKDTANAVSLSHEVRLPRDLAQCHDVIRLATNESAVLEREALIAWKEANSLRPKALKWDNWNKEKGRKRRQ
jgi:hypothetical protein